MKPLIPVALALLIASSAGAQTVLRPASSVWAINDTTAVGMADSSAIYQFANYSALGIMVKAQGQTTTRLAIQVRVHALPAGTAALPDSENTAVWFPSENSSIVSTGATDSLSYGYFRLGDSVTQGNGEIVVRTLSSTSGATKWGAGGNGMVYLYLPVKAPYISVRARVLSSNGVPTVKVMLVGLRN